MHGALAVRPARPDDVPELVAMVRELATYEKAEDQVEAGEEALQAALFGPAGAGGAGPSVFALVAELGGRVVGMAVYFVSFSTWTGRHGVYLEDLYVRPEARRRGAGRALLGELAARVVDRGYTRLEWSVLDWNAPAIDFYRACGAVPMQEWTTFRLDGDALEVLAKQEAGSGEP